MKEALYRGTHIYFLLHEVLEKEKLIYCLKKYRTITACGGWDRH